MDDLNAELLVVIGGSAGAVSAVLDLFAALPRVADAAICVALHQSPDHASHLSDLLVGRGHHAALGIHGERLIAGRVYVAPPDNHLEVRGELLQVTRGPRENNHRPSIDILFRSAAAWFGPRVLAILLSGHRDCGTSGLIAVKARGGRVIVQDPNEAEAPEMPRSAIAHLDVDHIVGVAAMPELVQRFVANGPRTEIRLATAPALGSDLLAQQADVVESALAAAARALEDQAMLSGKLAGRATGELVRRFGDKARMQAQQAATIRSLLVTHERVTPTPPEVAEPLPALTPERH